MISLKLKQAYSDLESIGSVANMGAEVLEGDPQASSRMLEGNIGDPLSCGIFGCTGGKYRVVYPFSEHATVVEGTVVLTDESTGESMEYHEGDSWFVKQGTPVIWDVKSDTFIKHFGAATQP
ncbi:cupin domain-containing protein [Vreelandella titanicae]|jgi:uncharacterized protein|uniref:cupin domain-containing protein n=1 Tax=Vreelandella titanicae TaxID=664683 RepID=UPI0037C259BC|tara:strand:+ start:170 stop:535 length:366 start_codon:yes stop_codon:yes gene_type:complete